MADEFKHLSAGTSLTQGEYEAVGGHVLACQATGDIVYASSGSQLSRLGKGAANTILAMGGSCIPAWTASPSVTDLTIGGGCITLSAATDIDLLDNTTSALSFDASGKAGIIAINTNNCSEGVTMSGTLTVGVDDTGADVKFFGASAGAYMEWDESANLLEIRGATAAGPGHLKLTTGEATVVACDVLGKIEFQAPAECGTDAITVAARIEAKAQGTFSATVNSTDLIFYTGHSEAATEKIRITSQGEIGIGGANYGTDGQVLTSTGAGTAPAWEDAAGGGVDTSGTPANSQIAVFTDCNTVEGDADLTYDETDFVVRQSGASALGSSIISRNYNDGGNPARIRMQTSRNDSVAHTAVQNGTPLGFVQFEGSDGSAFQRGAYIEATAGATWSGSNRQTYLNWYVTPSGCSTSNTLTMRLTSDGQLRLKDGSASAPSFSFNCDTDLGFYRHGTNAISFTGGAQQGLTFSDPGVIYARDTANGNMSIGLTLNQQATDNQILSLKSSDVAHGLTAEAETDTYGFLMKTNKCSHALGGLEVNGIVESGGIVALHLRAFTGNDDNSAASSMTNIPLLLEVGSHNGSNGDRAFSSNAKAVAMRFTDGTMAATRFLFDVEGDFHADSSSTTFDDYCDIELLRGFQAVTVPCYKETYMETFGKDIMYNLCWYQDNHIIGKDSLHWEHRSSGKWEHRAMVNYSALTRLHHSTIIQLADRVDARLTALENQIALQGGK